ncbi:MAG: phosphoserine phosphatase SerB [Allobranchiibius sp.]
MTQRPSPGPPEDTLLFTFTGRDSPGVLTDALAAISHLDEDVLDVGQLVVRGKLTVTLQVAHRSDPAKVRAALEAVSRAHELTLDVVADPVERVGTRADRASVVVMGAPLRSGALAAITAVIAEHGARVDRVRRLVSHPVTALDFEISGAAVPALRETLAAAASSHAVDVAVSPGGLHRRGRRLLVMDVDSTLIQDEVIELLAAHAGVEAQVAAITDRAMRGELDFARSLHERVATLTGLPVSVLADVRAAVRLTPGAETLVRTVKRLGFTVAVVSGGFIEIVGPLALELGIDHARANTLEVRDGHLTGRVTGVVVDRAEKARALRRFAADAGLPLSRTVAIGDGANDLDMLAIAGLGIAFNAKPIVRAEARATVSVPHLDAVLYLLGISKDEIDDAESQADCDSIDSAHA